MPAKPVSTLPPRAWLIVALLWVTVLFNYVARFLPTTMHGSILAAMPMTEAQFGLLTSSLFWTYGLVSPIAGFLADRFSRSRVIITSMILWSAITWIASFTRTFPQLVVLRSLMGIAEACYYPAALALIADYHRGPTRSLATALHQSGYICGLVLSGLAGWVAEVRSWHFAFALVGLAGLAYSVPLGLCLRDAPSEKTQETAAAEARPPVRFGAALTSLFGGRSFILALSVMGMLGFAGYTVIAWLPVFLQEHFNLTQGTAGISATGYMNIGSLPGLMIGGIWADRWSRRNRRARVFVPSIGLLLSAPGILLVANTHIFLLAIAGMIFYRLVGSFFESNMMPILCEVVDPRYRATGYGLLNTVATLAAGCGIYFSGYLRDLKIDLHRVFDSVAVITVICAGILSLIKVSKLTERT